MEVSSTDPMHPQAFDAKPDFPSVLPTTHTSVFWADIVAGRMSRKWEVSDLEVASPSRALTLPPRSVEKTVGMHVP